MHLAEPMHLRSYLHSESEQLQLRLTILAAAGFTVWHICPRVLTCNICRDSKPALEFAQTGLQQLSAGLLKQLQPLGTAAVIDAVVQSLPKDAAVKFVSIRGKNAGCIDGGCSNGSCRQQASEDQVRKENDPRIESDIILEPRFVNHDSKTIRL